MRDVCAFFSLILCVYGNITDQCWSCISGAKRDIHSLRIGKPFTKESPDVIALSVCSQCLTNVLAPINRWKQRHIVLEKQSVGNIYHTYLQ